MYYLYLWAEGNTLIFCSHRPLPSEVKPDLVEEPHLSLGLAQGFGHAYSHSQLFSSLPDVSSVGRGSTREESLGAGSSRSSSLQGSVSLTSQEQTTQGSGAELLDTSMLDWELDTLPTPERNTQAPEWERTSEFSWQNQDRASEPPAAFSESISQRVRRDRTRPCQADAGNEEEVQQSSGNNTLTGNDSQCEREVEVARVKAGDGVRPELLDFVGDWPSEGMEQREQRLRAGRGKATQQDGNGSAEQDGNPQVKMAEGAEHNKTEFQKLLDLLQIGTSLSQKQSSPSAVSSLDFMPHLSTTEDLSKDPAPGYQWTQSLAPSSAEGLDQKAGSNTRPELLDCVADWTLSDITPVRDTPQSLATETPPPSPAQTAILIPEREQEKRNLEECETSPLCRRDRGPAEQKAETPGGTVTSPVSGGSQERRFRQSRRSGKQCKLALTFTSPTSPRPPESPLAPPHPASITPEVPAPRHTHRSAQTDPSDFSLLWRLDRQLQESMIVVPLNVRVLVANCACFQPAPPAAPEPPTQQVVPYRVMHDKGTQVEEQELISSDSSKVHDLQILSRHFKLVSYDTLEDLYDKCHQDMEWTTNLLLDSGEQLFKDDEDNDPWSEEEQANKEHPSQGRTLDPKADLLKVCVERETPILLGAEQLKVPPNPESQGVEVDGSFEVVEMHFVPEESPALEEPSVTAQCSSVVEEPSLVAEGKSADLSDPGGIAVGQPKGELDAPTQLLDSTEAEAAGGLVVVSEHQDDPPLGLDLVCPASKEEGSAALLEEDQSKEPGNLPSSDEMTWSLVSQLEEMNRRDRLEEQNERDREGKGGKDGASQAKQDHMTLNIQSLELKLPAELAFQLSELFGPVGIAPGKERNGVGHIIGVSSESRVIFSHLIAVILSPGSWSPEDCSVQIDLNLARLLHQKWKETIQVCGQESIKSSFIRIPKRRVLIMAILTGLYHSLHCIVRHSHKPAITTPMHKI